MLAVAPVLLFSLVALANPVEEGARAWDQGDAATAIEVWSEAASQGTPSGVVLFDLGVAHYRMGDHARAAAYWRAARRLRPRDPRLVHNLARARNKLDGTPSPVPAPVGWMEFITAGEMGILGLLLLALASAGLWWRRFRPSISRAPWLVLGLAGLAISGTALDVMRTVVHNPVVVVVDAPAVARDVARAEGEERFELLPGSEVRVQRTLGDFLLVETGDGERGWVPRGAVLHVGPAPAFDVG
jgi:hypothetical protein